MRHKRFPRATSIPITPQRLAAANRAVKKDAESVGLFGPTLMKHATAEERIARNTDDFVKHWSKLRKFKAENWMLARRQLQNMPAISKAGILKWWQSANVPGDPEYLLEEIREVQQGKTAWGRLVEHKKLMLVGQGRLPNPWRKP